MAPQPGDENKGPNQAQPTSAATPGLTPPVTPLTPGAAEAGAKTPEVTEGAGERVSPESSRDYSTSDEEDSDVYADDGFAAGGGHAAASSEPLIPVTPTLTAPLAPEPTAAASLEEVKAFLSTPGLHFKSTKDYAQWFTPAAELVLGTPANPEAFKELLVKGLTDTASEKRLIAGVLNAYSQCKNEPEKLELSKALYQTLRKKLGSLMMAERAAPKSSTTSSPAPSTTEATISTVPPILVRSARTRVPVPDSSAVSDAPEPTSLTQRLMQRFFGKQDKPSAPTTPEATQKRSKVSSDSDTDSTSEGLRFRADKVFTENSDAFKISDDSMSDDDMTDRFKKAGSDLKDLEFSAALTTPTDDTAALPLIPQKKAQEESASQNSTPKPANGIAGKKPINNEEEWNRIVKNVSAYLVGTQAYKVDLETTSETTGYVSFSKIKTPPEGTLSMTRDDQKKLRMTSSLKPADPALLIRSFYETGQRQAVVTSSESPENTKGLWEAAKKHDGMRLTLAPKVLAEFKNKYPDLVEEYTKALETKSKPSRPKV